MIRRTLLILGLSLCTLTACDDDVEEYSDNNAAANNTANNNGNSSNNGTNNDGNGGGNGDNGGNSDGGNGDEGPVNNSSGLNNGWNPNNSSNSDGPDDGLNNDPNYNFCNVREYEDGEWTHESSCEGYPGQWLCDCGGSNKLIPASDSNAEHCEEALIEVCDIAPDLAYGCEQRGYADACTPSEDEEGAWDCTCEGSDEVFTIESDYCESALEQACEDVEPEPGESCERREENNFCQCVNMGGDNWDCSYSFSCEDMAEGGNGGGGGGTTRATPCEEALNTTCDTFDCK